MNRLRISVVIPTRNGARTLAACLESLRARRFRLMNSSWDDASSDGSGDIARRFDCRVIRADENIGAARRENRGARERRATFCFSPTTM